MSFIGERKNGFHGGQASRAAHDKGSTHIEGIHKEIQQSLSTTSSG